MILVAAAVGFAVGIGVMVLTFRVLFADRGEFFECVRYVFTPNWLSLIRGEFRADYLGTLKLTLWFLSGILPGGLAAWALSRLAG